MDDLDREIAQLLAAPRKCGTCGQSPEDVTFTADPFVLEIHGQTVMDWFCGNCLNKRHDDM